MYARGRRPDRYAIMKCPACMTLCHLATPCVKLHAWRRRPGWHEPLEQSRRVLSLTLPCVAHCNFERLCRGSGPGGVGWWADGRTGFMVSHPLPAQPRLSGQHCLVPCVPRTLNERGDSLRSHAMECTWAQERSFPRDKSFSAQSEKETLRERYNFGDDCREVYLVFREFLRFIPLLACFAQA